MMSTAENIKHYELIIFDFDGTLAEYKTGTIPDLVQAWFDKFNTEKPDVKLAIATNQGGVGLRHWMVMQGFGNPEQYPTEADVMNHIGSVMKKLGITHKICPVYTAFRYQSKKSGQWGVPADHNDPRWSIKWRKPNEGMLLQAIADAGTSADKTLMVGDWPHWAVSDEDERAAAYAGCDYLNAEQFFSYCALGE